MSSLKKTVGERVQAARKQFEKSTPPFGLIGEDVYKRTYSRFKKDGSKEEWLDTVCRVVEGNCGFVDPKHIEEGEAEKLVDLLFNLKVIPAGRHLWSTGSRKGRNFIANCWTSGWDKDNPSRHFSFLFARLMEGGGVGANYSDRFFKDMPSVERKVNLHVVCEESHNDYARLNEVKLWDGKYTPPFGKDGAEPDIITSLLTNKYAQEWEGSLVVDDSREGWIEALIRIIQVHFMAEGDPDLPAINGNGLRDVVIDVSRIRPSGAKLKGFGGTASGPFNLVWMLHQVNAILNEAYDDGVGLDWRVAMSLDHEISQCVVAGGIRRPARMAMKYWRDPDIDEFIECKSDGECHWTTNISVLVDDKFWRSLRQKNSKARPVLKAIVKGIKVNGEPGICDYTQCNKGEIEEFYSTNPCGEITMGPYGSCNLGHVVLSAFANDPIGLSEAFRLMTRFLIRATFADFPDEEALRIVQRDRRIGVGFTGFQNWLNKRGVRYSEFATHEESIGILRKMYKVVRGTAQKYAYNLRIPEPVKVSTVAPTGSISKLAGCSEGIQTIYAKYFIRRVIFSMSDPDQAARIEELKRQGYHVEASKHYGADQQVVSYYCRDAVLSEVDEDLVEDSTDLAVEDVMEVQSVVQGAFVDNSVAITVNFDPELSEEEIYNTIKAYGGRLKGFTMFPRVSNFVQAPYEAITREQWEACPTRVGDDTMSAGCGGDGSACELSMKALVANEDDDE